MNKFYLAIVSVLMGACLCVPQFAFADETPVQQTATQERTNTAKDTPAILSTQSKTSTTATKPNTGKGDLAPGDYYIVSALSASQVLDVDHALKKNGANVLLWHVNAQKNEQWRVSVGEDGYATIASISSGKLLDVANAKNKAGTNVVQWQDNGGLNQKWIIKAQDGFYVIYSALGKNLVLDITRSSTKNGTNVEIWTKNGGKNQLFSFIDVAPQATSAGTQTIDDGAYQIVPVVSSSRPVDIANASTKDAANAITWQANGGANQVFSFTYDGSGYYTITSVKSGKQLAPSASCSVSGVNVGQYALGGAVTLLSGR